MQTSFNRPLTNDKGPEPEGVTLVALSGRTYAFVGLERTGGLVVYDVSDPMTPFFVSYMPLPQGAISPEGLLFVSAADSPNGAPLLIVSYEVSGSTVIFEIVPQQPVYLPSVLGQ